MTSNECMGTKNCLILLGNENFFMFAVHVRWCGIFACLRKLGCNGILEFWGVYLWAVETVPLNTVCRWSMEMWKSICSALMEIVNSIDLSPQYLSIIYQGLFFFLDLQRYEKCCNWKQQTKSQLDCFGSSSKVCPLLLSFSLTHNRSGMVILRSQAPFCFNLIVDDCIVSLMYLGDLKCVLISCIAAQAVE